MEVTKPISMPNRKIKENILEKMIDIKSFDVRIQNKIFKFQLSKSEDKKYIIFKMNESDKDINNKYYLLYLNIDDFYNLNMIFQLYNIEEIYSLLLDLLYNKKYTLLKKENNIILIVPFIMPGGKNIDINFELVENKIKKEDLLDKIYLVINELSKENKLLKEEIKNKDNEIQNLINENIQIKNRLNLIEDFILSLKKEKEEKEKEKKQVFEFNKSYIFKNLEEKKKVKEWISENGVIKNIKLLYRETEDGDTSKNFFDKFSLKGPTLSIIKTKKGRKFGGFSMTEWTDKKSVVRLFDNKAFLYSLDYMKKYKILNPSLAIGCYPYSDCLVYGNNADANGLYLHSDCLKENKGMENHSSRVYDVPSDYCLSGENMFSVDEVEVYQIIFN